MDARHVVSLEPAGQFDMLDGSLLSIANSIIGFSLYPLQPFSPWKILETKNLCVCRVSVDLVMPLNTKTTLEQVRVESSLLTLDFFVPVRRRTPTPPTPVRRISCRDDSNRWELMSLGLLVLYSSTAYRTNPHFTSSNFSDYF